MMVALKVPNLVFSTMGLLILALGTGAITSSGFFNGDPSSPASSLRPYFEQSCPKNKPLDDNVLTRADNCIKSQFDGMLEQIAGQGSYHVFSLQICNTWPNIRNCMGELIDYVQDCNEDTLTPKVIDETANFLCGETLNGDSLSDFMTAGGVQCLHQNQFEWSKCFGLAHTESGSFCLALKKLRSCVRSALSRCNEKLPTLILTSLFTHLEERLNCCDTDCEATSSAEDQIDYASDTI